jgi:hypothetical protein
MFEVLFLVGTTDERDQEGCDGDNGNQFVHWVSFKGIKKDFKLFFGKSQLMKMVRPARFELAHPKALPPQDILVCFLFRKI